MPLSGILTTCAIPPLHLECLPWSWGLELCATGAIALRSCRHAVSAGADPGAIRLDRLALIDRWMAADRGQRIGGGGVRSFACRAARRRCSADWHWPGHGRRAWCENADLRPRPDPALVDVAKASASSGLPSTFAIFYGAAAAALVLASAGRRGWEAQIVRWTAVALLVAGCVGRVAAGGHWTSQVVASAALGAFASLAPMYLFKLVR